jgi:osmotically-inducible protein OsmY
METPQTAGSAELKSAAQEAARALGIDGPRVFMLGGVTHVEGTVPSFKHKKAAANLIGLLTGADHVVNRLRVAPRQFLSDRAISQRLQVAFDEMPAVKATAIRPEVRNGVVELHGTADSLSARCAAESAAWSVGGITSVVNRVRVAGAAVSPHDLARQMEADLCACLSLPAGSVSVEIQQSTVRLAGTVPSPYHRMALEDLARAHELVHDVVNLLTVPEVAEPTVSPPAREATQRQAS